MMARVQNVLRHLADRGTPSIAALNSNATVTKPKHSSAFQSCTKMVNQLQELFESREQDLQERETALEKRLQLFQATYPHAGKPSDVLHLNVGGSTNVAVLRRTLTHFENSMLASQFSGCWDNSLEKTKCGSFFIDQDPEVFMPLLNYLRHCDHQTGTRIKVPPPTPTLEFCSMLDYYGLLMSIYHNQWRRVRGSGARVEMTRDGPDGDSFTISSSLAENSFALVIDQALTVRSFTAVLDEDSTGTVGWATRLTEGQKLGSAHGWFAYDLDVNYFKASGPPIDKQLADDLSMALKFPVTIHCTRDPTENNYVIEVRGRNGNLIGKATFPYKDKDMVPYISLQGKVTISNVLYP